VASRQREAEAALAVAAAAAATAGRPVGLLAPLSDRVAEEADICRWSTTTCVNTTVLEATNIRKEEKEMDSPTELVRCKVRQLSGALRRSNATQAQLQELLARILDESERLRSAEADARRARDHHHHRWCVLDQEREGLQRVAQQARAAERTANAGERCALEEAAAWRRWLTSFLDILLRRGASAPDDVDVSSSLVLQERQPKIHVLLTELAHAGDATASQPALLGRLPTLYGHVAELITSGQLAVRWGSQPDVEANNQPAPTDADKERETQLERQLAEKEIAVAALEHEKRVLQSELSTLQNTLQELRGSVRVFCRIRPPRRKNTAAPLAAPGIGASAESTQHVALRKPPGDRKQEFTFDRVFPPDAGQDAIYEEVYSLLKGVLGGLHLCIFAYGQTGAGKTHTLSGSKDGTHRGIQDMAIEELLRLAGDRAQASCTTYEARLSALEIYNESIQDLLVDPPPASSSSGGGPLGSAAATTAMGPNDAAARLEVRRSREGIADACSGGGSLGESGGVAAAPSPFGSMRVPGLRSWPIHGPADVEPALRLVASNRHVAATALNERSSRSHCILSLSVVQRKTADGAGSSSGGREAMSPVGVLHIVDLAGSERTKVSQAEGQQMKEANCINRSLSSLADVLFAIGEGTSAHVPYRNSKLTYLLQDALGGTGCKTLLFAQVSPDPQDVHETYSTLTFAARVSTVQKGRLRPISQGALPSALPATGATTWGADGRRQEATTPKGSPQAKVSRDASHVSLASDVPLDASSVLVSPVSHRGLSGAEVALGSIRQMPEAQPVVTPERRRRG